MDPYATHLPVLVETALRTTGPILELGCGDYSTPVLAAIASQQGRRFTVQASDRNWSDRFKDIADVEMVDWLTWSPPPGRFGLVFLDNEEFTKERIKRLHQLAAVADVIVMHDADVASTRPHWAECTAGLTVAMHKRYTPWTAVIRC